MIMRRNSEEARPGQPRETVDGAGCRPRAYQVTARPLTLPTFGYAVRATAVKARMIPPRTRFNRVERACLALSMSASGPPSALAARASMLRLNLGRRTHVWYAAIRIITPISMCLDKIATDQRFSVARNPE